MDPTMQRRASKLEAENTVKQAPPLENQFSLSKDFVKADGARTLETVTTKTRIVKT
jgi:hypothetical protein